MAVVSKKVLFFDGGYKAQESKNVEYLWKSLSVTADGNDNGLTITDDGSGGFDFNAKNITNVGSVDGVDISTLKSAYDGHVDGGANKHDATEIDYERADGSKVDVQEASDEVESVLTDLDDRKVSSYQDTTMQSGVNLTFAGGGEVKGLPASPTVDGAAASKKYVDDQIATLSSGLEYKGTLDASIPDPDLDSTGASKGDFYKISVAGTQWGKDWNVGDHLIVNTDFAAGSIDNSYLDKVDNTESADLLKQSGLSDAQIFVGDGGSTPNAVDVSGDVTITNAGVTSIGAGKVTNAMLAGSIDDSKLNQLTTADKVAGSAVQLAASGGLEDSSGLQIAAGGVTDAMLAGSISDGKLAQDYIQTSEVGSGLEWTTDLHIATGGVTNDMLAGSIADSKLNQITTANKVAGSAVQLSSEDTIENNSGLQVNFKKSFVNNTGASIAAGKIVYIFNNAGTAEIKLADADDANSDDYDVGITAEEIADGASGDIYYMNGAIIGGFSGLTPGKKQYVSATAGELTETAPSSSGQHVYKIGRAYSATQIEMVPHHMVEIF